MELAIHSNLPLTQLEGTALVIAGLICSALILGRRGFHLPRAWSPYSAKPLLTAWERRALLTFRTQIPQGFYICPQVRLADMLTIAGNETGGFSAPLSKVASKSVDFAIIELASGRVALVVELDDRTHQTRHRRNRDRFVAEVLAASHIPLIRFRSTDRLNIGSFFNEEMALSDKKVEARGAASRPRQSETHKQIQTAAS